MGRRSAAALLAHWGDIHQVWSASVAQWAQVIGPVAAHRLSDTPDATFLQRQDAAWRWLQGHDGLDLGTRQLVTWADDAYPQALTRMPDPPLVLYVCGTPDAWQQRPCLAIVGSRNPTAQGMDHARHFARALSEGGWVIASGLALGVDGAAHEGALAASGPTVAVVGTGPESIYPRKHIGLAQRIVRGGGAIISEYPPGTPVRSENFPLRNRIIAGLSLGTLVVEAALESGSLITAKLAVESGREVFAIPGSIHSPHSKGCHALIRQGAKLVETAADILEEFSPGVFADARGDAATASIHDTLPALGHDPFTLDALSQRTGQSVAEVAAWLLELELQGQIARLPGGLFQRRTPL